MDQPRKPLSIARRIARAAAWLAFAAVLFLRFVLLRDEQPGPGPNRGRWMQQQQFRRPPTLVQPPVAPVPKDLPRLEIQIAPQDAAILRGYFWNGWRGQRQQERPEVLATVREGDTLYTNVTVHLKGAAGSFRPFDDKPALTLNFGKRAPGQRFHHFSKISLNNSVQDPTYLCEALCRQLYNAAGVPAPEANWATVVLNERDLGLYVMIEGYSKEFLHRHFKNVKGNLYDGGFVQDIDGPLAVNSGEHPDDRSDLKRLLAAARQPDPQTRWSQLNQILDTDRFITLLAMEVMLCHWDGYAMNRNNYRLFHDMEADRMVFMPHGMDQMFGFPSDRIQPEGSIQPMMRGIVAAAVISTPEGSRQVLERMQVLRTNLFNEEAVLGHVQDMAQHLRPTLAAYSPSMVQWHDAAVSSLTDHIRRRIHSVEQQLDTPREPMPFDATGTAYLTNWTVPFRTQGAGLRIDTVHLEGKALLHFSAANGGGTGSWRTRVYLPGGNYRFEGRARVSPEAMGGRVSLRISGDRSSAPTVDTADWVPLTYEFSVGGVVSEVVLVCEFSSPRGEGWFEVESLRLVKQ